MEEKSDGVGSLFIPYTTFVDILLLALKCATLKMSASFLVWMKTPSEVSLKATSSIADR